MKLFVLVAAVLLIFHFGSNATLAFLMVTGLSGWVWTKWDTRSPSPPPQQNKWVQPYYPEKDSQYIVVGTTSEGYEVSRPAESIWH